MALPGTNTLLAALCRDVLMPFDALVKRVKPPVGETGDVSADAYLARIFATMCAMEGCPGDRARQARHIDRAIDVVEGWIEASHQQEQRGFITLADKRSHALMLGRLQAWRDELRATDLDLAGQDIIEGRRATA
ncbi:hypothetical protein [Kaistia sp. UC242_56]|uniref:hypothetical protein n=1 Tax=Kaistia sp. UC242_56 TaxID=3374625 RepID=UPI0037A30E3D